MHPQIVTQIVRQMNANCYKLNPNRLVAFLQKPADQFTRDDMMRVIEEKADLWYNPAITSSEWHEEQQYVITIGSHRFFWMRDDDDV